METVEMGKFLTALLTEVNQFGVDLFVPSTDKKENERLIGTLEDEWLKKLWNLGQHYCREHQQYEVELRFASGGKEELRAKIERATAKDNLLKEIFWFGVRDLFNEHEASSVGMRTGWQVVEMSKEDQMRRKLGQLFEL